HPSPVAPGHIPLLGARKRYATLWFGHGVVAQDGALTAARVVVPTLFPLAANVKVVVSVPPSCDVDPPQGRRSFRFARFVTLGHGCAGLADADTVLVVSAVSPSLVITAIVLLLADRDVDWLAWATDEETCHAGFV